MIGRPPGVDIKTARTCESQTHLVPPSPRDRWVSDGRGNERAAGLRMSGPPSSHRRSSHERPQQAGPRRSAAALGAIPLNEKDCTDQWLLSNPPYIIKKV